MSKALVVGSGAMYGAYGAGVLAELGRQLGPEYFDSIYASSVGVFAATFFVAGQPDVIEETWRGHVDGRKLINLFRVWRALKLHYLEEIFQDERSRLDVDAVFRSRTRLEYVLTKLPEGRAVYHSPTRENIFRLMSASCAIPVMHGSIRVGGDEFLDGGLSNPLPVARALEDGAGLVVAVSNRGAGFQPAKSLQAIGAACKVVPGTLARLASGYDAQRYVARMQAIEMHLADPRVLPIRQHPLPLRGANDTNWARLKATVDLAVADARKAADELDKRR